MKRRLLSRRNKRTGERQVPSHIEEHFFFWLAGPGKENWKRWNRSNDFVGGAMMFSLVKEREDAECRSRILILMERLYRLDEMIKRGTRPDALISTINKSLSLYLSVPYVDVWMSPRRWYLGQHQVEVGRRKGLKVIPVLRLERVALELLKEKFQRADGWPIELKRCLICKNWFWARKPWAKFCTVEDCGAKAKREYQNSETYKSRRRKNYAYSGK
jgi:hypothetical protein